MLSPYGIFLAFNTLYNVFPWLANKFDLNDIFPLFAETSVLNTQLLLASSANLCFGLVFLFRFHRVVLIAPPGTLTSLRRRNFVLLTFPLFLATCLLSAKYGWHAYTFAISEDAESLGGLFTLTAYVKYCFVAVYIYYLYRFDFDRWASVLLAEELIVMVVDGGRTTVFPITFLTLMIVYDRFAAKSVRRKVYIGLALAICASVLVRSFVIHDESFALRVIAPVSVEGMMGAYPSLQSIYAISHGQHPAYTYGSSYCVDPFFWLLPQGHMRDQLSFLQGWVRSILPAVPDTQFAPMGGFYFLAEAVAAFSYFGPALVTACFAFALVSIENRKNKHRLFYLVWTSTIGILFVKTIFGNAFKLFAIEWLVVLTFVLGASIRNGMVTAGLTKSRWLQQHYLSRGGTDSPAGTVTIHLPNDGKRRT